jgi:hypothetical protein
MKTSQAELLEHLIEQVGFLDVSCRGYDEGNTSEAKRLATAIRVLVHDPENLGPTSGVSLLKQMGVKDSMTYIDGSIEIEPPKPPAYVITSGPLAGLAISTYSNNSWAYEPNCWSLAIDPARTVDFSTWWTKEIGHDSASNAFARQQFVKWLANKDGGAHVDTLPKTYREMSRGGSMGWVSTPGVPNQGVNPAGASVRQIAEELRMSLRRDFPGLGPNPLLQRPPRAAMHIGHARLIHDPDAPDEP